MNKLTPDWYSIANLSLKEICQGLAIRVSEPETIWKALHKSSAFGPDFFFSIIEKEYG